MVILVKLPKVCVCGHRMDLALMADVNDDGTWTFHKENREELFTLCDNCHQPLYPEVYPALKEMHDMLDRSIAEKNYWSQVE